MERLKISSKENKPAKIGRKKKGEQKEDRGHQQACRLALTITVPKKCNAKPVIKEMRWDLQKGLSGYDSAP